jgi:GAF domain
LTSRGDLQALKLGLNGAADAMSRFCGELRRIVHEVTSEGKLTVEMQQPNPVGEFNAGQEACNRLWLAYSGALRAAGAAVGRIERGEPASADTPPLGELGEAGRQLARLAEREQSLQRWLEALVEGQLDVAPVGGEGGREALIGKLAARLKHEWLRAARAALLEVRERWSDDAPRFAREVLAAVARSCGAEIGAYHELSTDGGFVRVASFGWDAPSDAAQITRPGEGLVGRAALERAPLVLDQLQSENVRVRSSLIELVPRSVLIFPVVHAERVVAVLELGFLRASAGLARELLTFVAAELVRRPAVAAAEAPLGREQVRAIEEELVIANARLQHVTQELRARDQALRELQQTLQALRDAGAEPTRTSGLRTG